MIVPPAIEHGVGKVTMRPLTVQVVSVGEKPEPADSVTVSPTWPEEVPSMMNCEVAVTANEAVAIPESSPLVVTAMAYVPTGPVTVNVSVNMPLPIVQGMVGPGTPVKAQVVSLEKNPNPETLTEREMLFGPEDGLRTSDGGRTVNAVDEKSPLLPVPVIVYVPARTLATVNESVRMPSEIVQMGGGEPTGLPDNVQVVSLDENPDAHT